MKTLRPLIVSTYPPEACGLATFAKDSADALDRAAGKPATSVAAISKTRDIRYQDPRVVHTIDNANPSAWRELASFVNRGPFDVVHLQHEFGLFPGEWGKDVLEFVRRCQKPLVTTFHTLLSHKVPLPDFLIRTLAEASSRVVVMTGSAARLLEDRFGLSSPKVQVIPHGVPEVAPVRAAAAVVLPELRGKQVISSFGLINRGKGLEFMIHAMPEIVQRFPGAIYLVMGVTHPQVKQREGEVYRNELEQLAASLGVAENVRFLNRFLPLPELLQHLQASDIFVTPYPGKDQIASGTLACAMATVGSVISTPYLYAREVLAEGRGQLVPFADSRALSAAVVKYLGDPVFQAETRRLSFRYAQRMFWPVVGKQTLDLLREATRFPQGLPARPVVQPTPRGETGVRRLRIGSGL